MKKLKNTVGEIAGGKGDKEEDLNLIADWDVEKEKSYLASKCLEVVR
jgi:hypothetical protein